MLPPPRISNWYGNKINDRIVYKIFIIQTLCTHIDFTCWVQFYFVFFFHRLLAVCVDCFQLFIKYVCKTKTLTKMKRSYIKLLFYYNVFRTRKSFAFFHFIFFAVQHFSVALSVQCALIPTHAFLLTLLSTFVALFILFFSLWLWFSSSKDRGQEDWLRNFSICFLLLFFFSEQRTFFFFALSLSDYFFYYLFFQSHSFCCCEQCNASALSCGAD